MDALTPEGIAALLAALPSMPPAEQEELLADLDELARRKEVDLAINSFLAFCHRVYPGFKEGPHHRNMAKYLEAVCFGAENRVTVSMPPRFGKSETISYLFVAWYLGHHPTHHIMMVTHTADLSADFGRKVRNLIGSEAYREIFTETVVASDKSAANNWATTLGGKYLAIGVGANAAGHGADLLIADDLVSEQAVLGGEPGLYVCHGVELRAGRAHTAVDAQRADRDDRLHDCRDRRVDGRRVRKRNSVHPSGRQDRHIRGRQDHRV
jgi:hypothetical protein